MPDTTQPIGPRLRAIREAGGLSLREVADRLGLTVGRVYQIEQEDSGRPRPETVRAYLSAVRTTLWQRLERVRAALADFVLLEHEVSGGVDHATTKD